MPPSEHITPKALRCLQNMAVAGPSTVAELNALDPTAPDHKQTIKALEQSGYVVAGYRITHHEPARYSLTAKALRLVNANAGEGVKAQPKTPRAPREKPRYARQPNPTAAGPVVHTSMTTKRLTGPCIDMLTPATRPGAEQALSIPSRVNDQLHYRDGRISSI